jgi:NHLM bacteriocin system ABC transporter peptidase/ATP-binding protein
MRSRRHRVPTVLQMEAVECGAACLAMILASFGRWVPLEELRAACGVSRDGSKANNMLAAARKYGLLAKGYRKEPEELDEYPLPMIVFWNFNHFVVLEGVRRDRVYLNDPGSGPRVITREEFDEGFTGVVLVFERGPEFVKGGNRPSLVGALARRLDGVRTALLYAVIAGLGLVIPGLVIPVFARVFIDNVLINRMDDWIGPIIIGLGITALMRAALTIVQQEALLRLNTKMALTTSSQFLWHVLRLPMDFFNQRWAGDVNARVQINDKVSQLLSGDLATTLVNILAVVFYAAVMFSYDWVLTVIGIAFAAVNVLALRYVSRRRVDLSRRLQKSQGQVAGASAAGIQMGEDLKATGTESEFFATWSGYYASLLNAQQRLSVYAAVLASVPAVLEALNTVSILAIGGLRVIDGHLSIGMLIAFQSLMSSFMSPIAQLVQLGGSLQEIQGDLGRLDDVLQYQVDPQVSVDTANDPADVVQLTGAVELRHVTFGYSRLAPPLIEDFNLVVKPGERVALVGGSGSGKSTVAKLVTGLYEPWAGEVLLDGQPRREVPRTVLNNSLALVDQDIFLFSGTIRDNLTLWDSTVLETAVIDAAHDAMIHDDIAARPHGYDASVDERGGNFSGGQRQRLEIARALAGNPTIIVLDEATSALDSATEKFVDDHLRRRGCTCLIIAHRLSTIRDADEIIVLERGRVVQRGVHEELKQIDGPYRRLIEVEG